MSKRKQKIRSGPITPELLPIPDCDNIDNQNVYSCSDGWTRTEIPESFYDELHDLLCRYGGVDVDGDTRLRATIIDRSTHDPMHYFAIPSDTRPNPDLDLIMRLLSTNLSIAARELGLFTQFVKVKKKI
jgi:hypothetical protein